MEYTAEGRRDNALVQMLFLVDYKLPFSSVDFEKVDKVSKAWKDDLPRRSVNTGVMLDPRTNIVGFQQSNIIGISYEALLKDGTVEFGLRIEGSRIIFIVGNYTRWDDIWPQAKKFIEAAANEIDKSNEVSSYSSEYTDLFRGKGVYTEYDPAKILRHGSKYIPNHIFERKHNWHFHTGFFEPYEGFESCRVLSRINADLVDKADEQGRDLSIVLFHSITGDVEPWGNDTSSLPKPVADAGLENFEALHNLDKRILREILNDEMSQKIGLR